MPLPVENPKLQQLTFLAELMDARFVLPGTTVRIGLDGLLGLVPVVGDTLATLVSLYLIKLARELGVPRHVRWRMGANVFIDWIIGLVPFIGDAFDIGWKANLRNLKLVRRHLHV